MKKLLLLFVILGMTGSGIYAQDSLTAGEKQLLALFGTIFSEAKHKIIEDSRTNGNKSIMGNALLEHEGARQPDQRSDPYIRT